MLTLKFHNKISHTKITISRNFDLLLNCFDCCPLFQPWKKNFDVVLNAIVFSSTANVRKYRKTWLSLSWQCRSCVEMFYVSFLEILRLLTAFSMTTNEQWGLSLQLKSLDSWRSVFWLLLLLFPLEEQLTSHFIFGAPDTFSITGFYDFRTEQLIVVDKKMKM